MQHGQLRDLSFWQKCINGKRVYDVQKLWYGILCILCYKKSAWFYDGILGRFFMICKINVFVNLNLI